MNRKQTRRSQIVVWESAVAVFAPAVAVVGYGG